MTSGTTESWLAGLAQDILDHEGCFGCQCNAAAALDHLGLLAEVLGRLGKPDPREQLRVDTGTESTPYGSSLTLTLDDGTVLRDAAAHDRIRCVRDEDA